MTGSTNSNDAPWMLAAIVEVDKADRVQCQCNGCGRSVYRKVHIIVWPNDRIECWGSTCYQRELGAEAERLGIQPVFTGSSGRRLTADERLMLSGNRNRLIEWFKEQRERLLAVKSVPAISGQSTREHVARKEFSMDIDPDAQERINQAAKEIAARKRAKGWGYRGSR